MNMIKHAASIPVVMSVLAFPAYALPSDGDGGLSFEGSHRHLIEYIDNQFRPGRSGDDFLWSLRTSLKMTYRTGGLQLGAELNDTRAYGISDSRNVRTASVNAVEPLQYYLKYNVKGLFSEGDKAYIQAGRLTYDLGSRRVIGRQRYRNSINSFMGAKALWQQPNFGRVEAFYLYPSRIKPNDSDGLNDNDIEHDNFSNDQRIAGIFIEPKNIIPAAVSRLYFVDLSEKDNPDKLATRNRQLKTVGMQLQRKRSADAFDFDIEGAYQWGSQRQSSSPLDTNDLSVKSGFLHAEAGYSFGGNGQWNIAATYDYASGDKDPNDGKSQRYDPLFGPIRGDLGPTGLFTLIHRSNISAPGVRFIAKPGKGINLTLHWQAVWLDSTTDQFSRTGVRDTTGQAGKFAGHQMQLRMRMPLIKDQLKFELGAVFFRNGKFFKNAASASGNGNPFFTYSMLTFNF